MKLFRALWAVLFALLISLAGSAPTLLSPRQISPTGATAGQALLYNGSQIVWGTVTNSLSSVKTVTATYTAAYTDEIIRVDASAGAVTITLPSAVGDVGDGFTVIKVDSSANAVTVQGTSSQTVGGAATLLETQQFNSLEFISNNTNWDLTAQTQQSGRVDIYGSASASATVTATWTKPIWATSIHVVAIGGGGGAGGGRKGAAATARSGGSGGGGGSLAEATFAASALPSTVTVTAGLGGTRGALQNTDSTNGNAGGVGGASSFGAYLRAVGGSAGLGGTNAVVSGGAGAVGLWNGSAGAASSVTAAAANASNAPRGGSGGGAGGSVTSGDVIVSASIGGGVPTVASGTVASGGGPASGGATDGAAPANATNNAAGIDYGGMGGSGGAATKSSNGGSGGSFGGFPGGGAGGGGAGLDATAQAGPGGAGGNGVVLVFSMP